MSMSTANEYPQLLEIDAGDKVSAVTFTPNKVHIVAGCDKSVQVWRVADGKRIAAMKVDSGCVTSVSVSKDGKWIAAGSWSNVFVWDAATYEREFAHRSKSAIITSVDFSPDSTRLVSADRYHRVATIWDIVERRKEQKLTHHSDGQWVFVAKYSPQGDKIATATLESIRVWDSKNGRLLIDIKVPVKKLHDPLWFKDCLIVQTNDGTLKQINADTGSTLFEWSVLRSNDTRKITLPEYGQFIACSARETIIFWDTVTHTQLGLIPHSHDIRSIACSSDGQLLLIASERKIIVRDLSFGVFPLSEPELHIDSAALIAWKQSQLTRADALLSEAIRTSKGTDHHVFASRALVRARLGQWEEALVDANESIEHRRSVIGFIAMCVALVGKGETLAGRRACNIALRYFHSKHVSLLLLIKAIVLFMAGECVDAILRMDDLITDAGTHPALYVVQAHMHLLLGNERMMNGDYKRAVQSFEDARIKLAGRTCQPPLIVTLISGWRFDDLAITIQQRLCEALLVANRMQEASESILHAVDEETNMNEPIRAWISDFKFRCRCKLEDLGDGFVSAGQYAEAVSQYTAALSLDPIRPQDLLVKRSKAYIEQEMFGDALSDANEAIEIDPTFPSGYETKHAALLGMGHHDDAIDAIEKMISKMSESSDPEIRERSRRYVRPEQTKEAIRTSIKRATRDSPPVLINTFSGRLCNKSEQAAAFESTLSFTKIIASMTAHIDYDLIEQAVEGFYRYATFSHTWEHHEPVYEKVIKIVVYDLDNFPTHEKLRMFCKIVRDEGFHWAWSDTCCIDKGDHVVLQEALVTMFKWYEGSAMTIIFLCDVDQLAGPGALTRSRWNSHGWTLQEYHASKVVRIYTKDWTPYLGLTVYNHKESPEIILEMEKVTGIATRALMALHPGLSGIRQKLCLASTRQTTRVEDAAYSLLGIFSMSLPVTYGEGDKALGRLLSQLLMSSGDTGILAWSGRSAIDDAKMGKITAGLRASSLDLSLATKLYDRVHELRTPTFAGQRMRLPCLAFKITDISRFREGSEDVFRAQAGALGVVQIMTRRNLLQLRSLYLIHPWIDFLLDRLPVRSVTIPDEHEHVWSDTSPSSASHGSLAVSPIDKQLRVYQFLARLRQPFGALLLTSIRRNALEHERIATEDPISVQVKETTPLVLDKLIQHVQTLDIL